MSVRSLGAASLLLIGCGRFGFGEAPRAVDAALLDTDVEVDAPLGAFSPPTLISELSQAGSFDADGSMTEDLLEIYFVSDRAGGLGGFDLWTSQRAARTAPWSPPTVATALDTAHNEGSPQVARDGLTIWFASNRPGGVGLLDIWVSTRQTRAASWSTATPVTEVNTAFDDRAFAVTASGLVAYFDRNNATDIDLCRSARASTSSPWSAPTLVTELSLATVDQNPFPLADELSLYFSKGDYNRQSLQVTTRASAQEPFSPSVELTTLSSGDYESDPWLGDGGHLILFSSNRNGGSSQFDLFTATR